MAKTLASARSGFRRLFSISAFTPPPPATAPPPAEPSPNLFVSGLSKRTTSEGLREAFSKFGNVVNARVVTDRVSGYSKGFGFVRYATIEQADEGIKGMDGKFLDGWVIFAEYAKPRPPPPSQAQSSQLPPNTTSSAPPSNYATQTSPAWASYQSSQATEPLSSHCYTQQETQTTSNHSYHSAQTLQTPPNYNSAAPSTELSAPPSGFASIQGSKYSQASEYASGTTSSPTSAAAAFSFPTPASNSENSSGMHQHL